MRKLLPILLVALLALLNPFNAPPRNVAAQSPIPPPPGLTSIEPGILSNQTGGIISVYGRGFITTTTVRVVGYGMLTVEFINTGALRATIPAGIPTGVYSIVASNGPGSDSNILNGALQITAPSIAPTASAPTPGRPILTLRSYSIQPDKVRPGQEFLVTLEIYNNGSRASENTLVTFPGGAFLPVGESGHNLWQMGINATAVVTQVMRVPSTIASGIQSLQVVLSGNDFEGTHYDYPQTIGVETIGNTGGTGTATGAPKLVIENVKITPEIVGPGNPFTVTMTLGNHGRRTATNVVVGTSGALAIPAEGSNMVAAPQIQIDKTAVVTLPLILGEAEKGGRQNLTIALQYSDPSGGNYTDQQNVGLDINTSLANRPQLLIAGYETAPNVLSPGDRFTLTLSLSNVGGGDAQRLLVSLGGEGGEKLENFVPVDSSNVRFLQRLNAGTTITVTHMLIVDGKAEPKAYNLPIALAYDDARGNRKTEIQRISMMVFRRPQFQAKFSQPMEGMAMVGMPFSLPIEVVNIGTSRINVPSLEAQSDKLQIENSSIYVGNLEPGSSWLLDSAMATASESGPVEVNVLIHYLDDFNQPQVLTQTLSLDVMEAPQIDPNQPTGPTEPEPSGSFLDSVGRFFMGLLGLGS